MNGYKIQNGCHNCRHVFKYISWDDGPHFYCNINKDKPECNDHDAEDDILWAMHSLEVEQWHDRTSVHACGKCLSWKNKG